MAVTVKDAVEAMRAQLRDPEWTDADNGKKQVVLTIEQAMAISEHYRHLEKILELRVDPLQSQSKNR